MKLIGRRHVIVCVITLVWTLSLMSIRAQSVNDELLCSKLGIIGPNGKVCIVIQGTETGGSITLLSAKDQTPRITFLVTTDDVGAFKVFDSNEVGRLGFLATDEGSMLAVLAPNEASTIGLTASKEVGAYVYMEGQGKHKIIAPD